MPQWILHLCRMLLRWLMQGRRPIPTRHGWKRTLPDQPMRQSRKPAWVADELIRLKALMPQAGCRRIADTFNRRFAANRQMTVSKSYAAYTLRGQRYEIECLRRKIRQRRPGLGESNRVWGLDLTGKQDIHGQQHVILGLVDHGTRRLLTLSSLPNKSAWTLLGYVFLAIGHWPFRQTAGHSQR